MSETLAQMTAVAASIVLEAGFWIVVSLLAGCLVHEFLPAQRLRAAMRRAGALSMLAAVGSGALLPNCSCGVVPLVVSSYLSGVRLAAVLAFAIANPVINPAALILSYALLGPRLTLAYLAFGLVTPFLMGYIVERWGKVSTTAVAARLESCCAARVQQPSAKASLARRLLRALQWGFGELGPTLGLYIGLGAAIAAVLAAVLPADWIGRYLGASAPFTSLLFIALFSASIYVCAVAHIPLIAALLGAGAAPGAAIVFLVTGAATNLPEFIALQRVFGTRAMLLYVGGLVGLSLFAGTAVNLWLPDYRPVIDPARSLEWMDLAARLTPVIPQPIAVGSAIAVAALIVWGLARWFHALQYRALRKNPI